MLTYPFKSISMTEAINLQFKIVDDITKEFKGKEFLTRGDLGVTQEWNKPFTTKKAENVIASIFDAEACLLVRGAGSGAIRFGLHAILKGGDKVLVHKAPVYTTTAISLEMLNITAIEADYNDNLSIEETLKKNPDIRGAIIQYARQKLEDCYNVRKVVEIIKNTRDIPILTDDNYVVMKVKEIGVQCGADLSCFSSFKILGPEGIGVIVGSKKYIDRLARESYSGGMQTQGHEALDVLRGLVYAPVALAVQSQVNEECLRRLNEGEIEGIKNAVLANAQSKVLLVEFEEEIAEKVLAEAEQLGAAPYPVGAESKYEITPMFYRISGTVRRTDPLLEHRMIRINAMRAGADTVLRILKEALERVRKQCL